MLLKSLDRVIVRAGRRFVSVVGDGRTYGSRKNQIEKRPLEYYPVLGEVRGRVRPCRLPQFREQFELVDFGQWEGGRHPGVFAVEGKIASIRRSGRAMYFIDIVQDSTKVQIVASNQMLGVSRGQFDEGHLFLRRGDYICCVGFASRTKVGELSIKVTEPVKLASPCLNLMTIPDKLKNRGLINSNRVLNYLVNADLKLKILIKAAVTQSIRKFLLQRQFVEVQTPILSGEGTGANAEPFRTVLKALSSTSDDEVKYLQLRVAPELWLKKLVISGFDKVFEIGPSFRNEGIDLTHNPEFTSCEFYQSFTDLTQLMEMTEQLFAAIYTDLENQDLTLAHKQLGKLQALKLRNFLKYEFVPTLEKFTGVPLPSDLTSESLVAYHEQIGLKIPTQVSPYSLLDNLSSTYLEPISHLVDSPIFIYNQPALLSPLAKSTTMTYGDKTVEVSLRFELFIKGKEYVNSYEEENSPFEQARKFKLQNSAKDVFNDEELIIPDWEYVKLMEYGLPPTGGWGCGIDRLSMLFSGSDRIEEVLPFGNVRDVTKQ